MHGIEKVQILSPFRSEGPASVEQLNAAIRELVNPARDEFADLKVGSHYFRVGDKVMQTKNNAKASNGDIGYIRKMARNAKNEMVVTIEFSGDRTVLPASIMYRSLKPSTTAKAFAHTARGKSPLRAVGAADI